MTDLALASALELARLVRSGATSAVEVARAALARLEAVNPAINAVVELRPEAVLAEAGTIDARIKAGEDPGLLAGVPVTIKVNVDQAGYATTNGIVAQKDLIASEDSAVVANFRRAGAVPLGRTNTPAFSYRYFTNNDLHGRTRNPRNPRLTPGGSSGGASASLAAGIGAIAHGNDLGGSVRYPAYAVGVCGIRPSFGRVPAWSATAGTVERPITLQMFSVQGPLARNIDDLRAGLAAMAQADPRDPWWTPAPLEGLPTRERRVAFARLGAQGPIAAALERAAAALQTAGWTVEEAALPHWDEAAALFQRLLMTDSVAAMGQAVTERGDDAIRTAFDAWRRIVPLFEPDAYREGLARRTGILRDWGRFLDRYAVVLLPASLATPYPDDHDLGGDEVYRAMLAEQAPQYVVNFLGLPGLVVPTDVVDAGIPLGIQLLSARFREDLCLAAGAVVEAHCGVPAVATPAGA